jgi:hypothetical protein
MHTAKPRTQLHVKGPGWLGDVLHERRLRVPFATPIDRSDINPLSTKPGHNLTVMSHAPSGRSHILQIQFHIFKEAHEVRNLVFIIHPLHRAL